MVDTNEERAKGIALAGGAIASAILDSLNAKGILTLDECRAVLGNALRSLGTTVQTPGGYQASQLIISFLQGGFPHAAEMNNSVKLFQSSASIAQDASMNCLH